MTLPIFPVTFTGGVEAASPPQPTPRCTTVLWWQLLLSAIQVELSTGCFLTRYLECNAFLRQQRGKVTRQNLPLESWWWVECLIFLPLATTSHTIPLQWEAKAKKNPKIAFAWEIPPGKPLLAKNLIFPGATRLSENRNSSVEKACKDSLAPSSLFSRGKIPSTTASLIICLHGNCLSQYKVLWEPRN